MIGEFKLVVVAIRITKLEAVKVVVDERRVVGVIDIPVQANHVFLGFLHTITWLATWIVVVDVICDGDDAIVVGLAQPIALLAIA